MMSADPLGDMLLLAAPFGLAGVVAMALIERVVPILPSQGLFAAIGAAAAEGLWCLPTAIAASVLGSAIGAFAAYCLGTSTELWRKPSDPTARRSGPMNSLKRIGRSSVALPFTTQLLPGARLVAPFIAGTMRQAPARILLPMLAGLTVWNAGFIAFGYSVVWLGGADNVTVVSIAPVLVVAAFLMIRHLSRSRIA